MPITERKINRVLVVDDEPDILAITSITLSSLAGWEVETATRGDEALAQLADSELDVILLDVMMPGMDGPETLRAMQDAGLVDDIPVIFMTAKVLPGEVGSHVRAGAAGVIAKPFDPMTLPSEIEALVAAA